MQTLITEEIAHISGIPKKLVIFLHGYIDSAPSIDKKLITFLDGMQDYALHIPQAPLTCEIHENKRQWYSMHRFDPDDARKFVPTFAECLAYYDKMSPGLEEAYAYLGDYVDQCLNDYGLEEKDLYLCGFSQGAMLALYTALRREKKIAGCVSFSGILAGGPYILKHYHSTPEFLLIHGDGDNLVRYEALQHTASALQNIGCKVRTLTVGGGKHMVTDEGLAAAGAFIAGTLQK